MGPSTTGGVNNWRGLVFEQRLAVEYCVYILTGEYAGLPPGPLQSIQLQAPSRIDDLVLVFESGSRWASQAKSGSSLCLEWDKNSPFGKALRQLYDGAPSQISLAFDSMDRLILAGSHRASDSLDALADWLEKARYFTHWQDFVEASEDDTKKKQGEKTWCKKLPSLVGAQPNDDFLIFVRHLYVERRPPPHLWWNDLRGNLHRAGVPDWVTAETILDVLMAQISQVAPQRGTLDFQVLQSAVRHIHGFPRPGTAPFRVIHNPTEEDLSNSLEVLAINRATPLVDRRELDPVRASGEGCLIVGRPGSGKSTALAALGLSQPGTPLVVVKPHFNVHSLGALRAATGELHGQFRLLWDDVQEKPKLFIDCLSQAADRQDPVKVLATSVQTESRPLWDTLTPDDLRRLNIDSWLLLKPFDANQAAEMAELVNARLRLQLDPACLQAFAEHILESDGGPLFAFSLGQMLAEDRTREPITVDKIRQYPRDLLETWQTYYRGLSAPGDRYLWQHVLVVLRFLHDINCPLAWELVELLYVHALGHTGGDLDSACQDLERRGWLECRKNDIFIARISLLAVTVHDLQRERLEAFVRRDLVGFESALGRLRQGLAQAYAGETRGP